MREATTAPAPPAPAPAPSPGPPRRKRRWVWRVALGLLVLFVLYVGSAFAQVWWASRHDDAAPAGAIVVLGAAQWNGKPSPVHQARLDHAADLYQRGVARTIVVSGGKQSGDRTTEGKAGYDYLRSRGVPDGALKVEVGGTDTYEELSAVSLILRQSGLGNKVVLVTDPYHAFRSESIASEVGLDGHVSPTGEESSLRDLGRETVAVSLGRVLGYRRLSNLS